MNGQRAHNHECTYSMIIKILRSVVLMTMQLKIDEGAEGCLELECISSK
jgi:hypothetical protein